MARRIVTALDRRIWERELFFNRYPKACGTAAYKRQMRAILPGREARGLYMSFPTRSLRVEADNDFTVSEAMKDGGAPALMVITPTMKTGAIEAYLDAHPSVVGFKPYLFYSTNKDAYNSRPREFLPDRHVAIAHKRGLLIMFHMSRQLCMADPLNRKDLLRFNRKYPNARWILAHCARGFIPWTLRESLHFISRLGNTWLGTSGVTSYETFDVLYSGVPNERILFGTDNRLLRGQTVELGETWTVVLERTLAATHMHSKTAVALKLYEQLRAMARAARRNKLSKREIGNIFWNNAVCLLASVGG